MKNKGTCVTRSGGVCRLVAPRRWVYRRGISSLGCTRILTILNLHRFLSFCLFDNWFVPCLTSRGPAPSKSSLERNSVVPVEFDSLTVKKNLVQAPHRTHRFIFRIEFYKAEATGSKIEIIDSHIKILDSSTEVKQSFKLVLLCILTQIPNVKGCRLLDSSCVVKGREPAPLVIVVRLLGCRLQFFVQLNC